MFKIISCNKTFLPICEGFPMENEFPYLYKTSFSNESDNLYQLFFCNTAFNTICSHIGFGENIEVNQVEQGGILVGNVYQKKDNDKLQGLVKYAIPALLAEGSMTHFEIGHNAWYELYNAVDTLNQNLTSENQVYIIGWYHTHPKHLRVYMSKKDLDTQQRFFYLEYHFSVILNPQQKIWRIFHGKNATECEGIIIK